MRQLPRPAALLAGAVPLAIALTGALVDTAGARVGTAGALVRPSPGSCTQRACARASGATLQAQLTHELSIAGAHSGAYVYDLTSRTVLFSERADLARPPASVEKLYTAATALELMGPSATLSTTVLGSGRLAPGGVWEGDLYLRGGGDPTFGSSSFIARHYAGLGASVRALAAQLVQVDGIHSVTGTVKGDESYFDSLRGEPASGYRSDPFLEGTLSALAFDRGEHRSERGAHAPAAYAARALRAALRADGVAVPGGGGAGKTPAGASQLAQVRSPSMTTLLHLMLPHSDNFFAETILKDLGAGFGGAGTSAAGARVVSQTTARLGVHPRVVDGSGLSRSDHTSPHQVVTLLGALAASTIGATLRGALAVAGRTGTLEKRMRGSYAAGRCEGKTGTLIGVSNLAGYCQAKGAQEIAFALFTDGIETAQAHALQDAMTVAIARY